MWSRRRIAQNATAMALRTRRKAGFGLTSPVNPFDACDALNLEVRFVDIPSMEGVLVREPKPRILISAVRPAGRQAFTCAHELGHLVLGHDSVVDELDLLTESSLDGRSIDDDEFAADQFAAFFLMPKTAVQSALRARGIDPRTSAPGEFLKLARWFGVGYSTLLAHLAFGLQLMPRVRYDTLRKERPQKLRAEQLGSDCTGLSVVDRHWDRQTVDVRVGEVIWFPENAVTGELEVQPAPRGGWLLSPDRAGVFSVTAEGIGAISIRTTRGSFEGRSLFRYLPPEDDDAADC